MRTRMTRQQREERQNAIYGEHHEAAAFPDDYRDLANIINLHGKDIRFRGILSQSSVIWQNILSFLNLPVHTVRLCAWVAIVLRFHQI